MMRALPVNPLLAGVIHQAFVTENKTVADYRVLPSAFTVIGFQFSGRILPHLRPGSGGPGKRESSTGRGGTRNARTRFL